MLGCCLGDRQLSENSIFRGMTDKCVRRGIDTLVTDFVHTQLKIRLGVK